MRHYHILLMVTLLTRLSLANNLCGLSPEPLGMATFNCSGSRFTVEIINFNTATQRSMYYEYSVDCSYISKNMNTPKFFSSNKMKFAFCSQDKLNLVEIPFDQPTSHIIKTIGDNGIRYANAEACAIAANTINSRLLE